MDRQILRSPPCQAGPERVAKALFRDRPSRHRTHPGPLKPKCTSENAPVAQLDRAPDYESGGQEFESLRARHFGTKLGTPKPADFAPDAVTSVRRSTLFDPMMRTSFVSTSMRWASARRWSRR